MTTDDVVAAVAGHSHWYHRIELAPGVTTPGINDSEYVLELIGLPEDLHGKRVLDLGARDGYFSFVCERRGASVIAIDYLPAESTGFAIAAAVLGSRVPYIQDNIYRLSVARYGTFDYILMLGLLYHLRDPLGALDIMRDLCTDMLVLETHVCDEYFVLDGDVVNIDAVDPRLERSPIMQFCPGNSLNADWSNYWAPNTSCVEALLREAAFTVAKTTRVGNRSLFHATIDHDADVLYQRAIARGEAFPTTG